MSDTITKLGMVAMGKRRADLLLVNCKLVSVYTNEIIPDIQIAISQDRIAYVGNDATHTRGSNTKIIDIGGRYVCPGLADPHMHLDQFVTPSEFAKTALLHGVTSLFSDPIDIVSVAGYRGFKEFLRLTRDLQIRIFQTVPGGLPVDPKFSRCNTMSLSEEQNAIKDSNVLGMGEVFSWTKVILQDPKTLGSITTMLENDCIINGHTAGATDKKLNAYISSGILSCHEPINFDQVLERLRLGMWIMIREGSIRRDLKDIILEVHKHSTHFDRLMFCSDGINPLDISKIGYIDHCVRESIDLGIEPVDAISMASRNCFDYYNLGKDLGGIAPGRLGDIIIFDDLNSFKPRHVFVGGKHVVSDGMICNTQKAPLIPKWLKDTVHLAKVTLDDLAVKTKKRQITANTIHMVTEIITRLDSKRLDVSDGAVVVPPDSDIWKVAAFDRTMRSGKHSIGFLENFGSDIGAIGSTWSFHENNMIIIGSNDSDMVHAANHLIKHQGGLVVVKDGEILSFMRLDLAGIMSTDPFAKVVKEFENFLSCMADSDCKFPRPHMIPLFLPFLALPSVRILADGIVDVKSRKYIKPIQ